MNCPACTHSLEEQTIDDVTVDVCQGGCGGVWFDNFELKHFDEPHEVAGVALLEISRSSSVKVDYDRQRTCPKCDGIVMLRNFFSAKRDIEVDLCGSCNGMWLDFGELNSIRNQFPTEEARKEAASKLFNETCVPTLEHMVAESRLQREQAEKFKQMFSFILPSSVFKGLG